MLDAHQHIYLNKQHGSGAWQESDRCVQNLAKQSLQCKIIPEKDTDHQMKTRTSTTKTACGEAHREPRSVADYDKAMGLIFCPSCRGSQEQLQLQGSIRSAAPLLRSPSRSIINDTEKQGRSCRARCPAHAGASGGGRWVRHTLRGAVRERGGEGDMLLAS